MTSNLKPCPFCGGEAMVNTLKWRDGYTATALCKNEPNTHYLETWDEDEAKAVESITDAWNTRAERTCGLICHEVELPDSLKEKGVEMYVYECDECGERMFSDYNFCPNCGAKVVSE